MVHLAALPGTPRWGGSMADVITAALADARALADGGADAFIVENYGDVPFSSGRVDAASVAAMTAVVGDRPRRRAALRGQRAPSDALSSLAIAAATGARFVRVNVHVGAVVTDQGVLQSGAHDTLRYRRLLSTDTRLLADVQAKHGVPLAPVPIEHEARDAVARGLADGLIVTASPPASPRR